MPSRIQDAFETLRVEGTAEIVRVTFDNPPINLLDAAMLDDLDRLGLACVGDPGIRVIVFDSADAEFFIAHADVRGLIGRGDAQAERREHLSRFAQVTERFRMLPAVTIALIEGRARGGGSEFALALDLRYAAIETAVLGQPEVGLGLLPGGGATQRLPALAGRSRALEIMLTGDDYDAETAERYGWITRALPRAELRPFVERLAARIARFSQPATAAVKQAVERADGPLHDGLREEHRLFRRTLATAEATAALEGFLDSGGQTRDYELDFGR
jgi:enoyl-CoA hydratase/carnithine racemase